MQDDRNTKMTHTYFWGLSPEVKWSGREADHSSHLLPRLRMCGAIHLFP